MSQFKKFWAEIATIVGAVLLIYQLAQAFTGNRSLVTGLLILVSLVAIGVGTWNYAFAKSTIPGIPRYKFHLFAKTAVVVIFVFTSFSVVYVLTILDLVSDCCGFVPIPTLTSTASDTSTPTPTPTFTLSPMPTTISNATYIMIVLDASGEMLQEFDGKTKWGAVLESVRGIIAGLDPEANYGLIVIGGEPMTNGTNPCNEPSALKMPFTVKEKISEQIDQLKPTGGGSLYTAFSFANNQFRKLPPGGIGTLIYITGSSDICDQNEWDALERLFDIPGPGGIVAELYSEIIIIDNDKEIRRTIQEQLASLSQNLNVQAPPSFTYIQEITNNTVIDNVSNYVNITVSTFPTAIIPAFTPTSASTPIVGVTNPPPSTPIVIPPTQIPPTPIPPTPTPQPTSIPAPSVLLTGFNYVGTGEGCSANIHFQVNDGPVSGYFRVTNDFYRHRSPPYDNDPGYPFVALLDYPNGFQVGLGGSGDPINYYHEVWFEYNGVESNHLSNLICPGLTPPTPTP